jgi:hypothetical protein
MKHINDLKYIKNKQGFMVTIFNKTDKNIKLQELRIFDCFDKAINYYEKKKSKHTNDTIIFEQTTIVDNH